MDPYTRIKHITALKGCHTYQRFLLYIIASQSPDIGSFTIHVAASVHAFGCPIGDVAAGEKLFHRVLRSLCHDPDPDEKVLLPVRCLNHQDMTLFTWTGESGLA